MRGEVSSAVREDVMGRTAEGIFENSEERLTSTKRVKVFLAILTAEMLVVVQGVVLANAGLASGRDW